LNIQLAVLLGYSALLIGIGLFVSRRIRKSDDFLVAGRSLGPGLIATTFLAANIGAGSTVGATGLGYLFGLGAWWWVGCAGIGSLILANTVGPKIWALAAEHGWRTVGDFLDYRYDRSVRGLIASMLWVGTLMILAGQLMAISDILQAVTGLQKWQGCVIGGGVVAAYFVSGGLLSSAWVNVVQLTIKLVGFALAIPFALAAVGGWSALRPALHATTPLGAHGIIGYVAILVPSFIVSPGLIQKLYGARDQKAVRTGININALGLLAFAFAPAILGLIARSRYPALANQDMALPTVMTTLLPPWLGLLTLAAIFSAELSASDAILFMLSSSLSIDLYKTFLKPAASDRNLLVVARLAAVAAAIISVLLAIVLPSIIAALQAFYALLAVALTAPMIVGLYSRRPKARRAIIAVVGAVSAAAAFHVLLALTGQDRHLITSAPIGIVAGFLIMIAP
jgi:SSS family solute:Na+ symporter